MDALFLDETFDRCNLLKQLSVTNLVSGEDGPRKQEESGGSDLQDLYLRQVEAATTRLRQYLEVLTN